MMDPSRHVCRSRPMVCTGPCNPLRTRPQHHHHHHHRRHQCQRPYAATSDVTATEETVTDELLPMTLLKSLTTDTAITSAIPTIDKSTSGAPPFGRIALIKVSSAKTVSPQEADVQSILREILAPGRLEMLARKVGKPPLPMKTVHPSALAKRSGRPLTQMKTMTHGARMLNHAKYAVVNGVRSSVASPVVMYLFILLVYVAIHSIMVTFGKESTMYQVFLYSQICGIFVLFMWRITGTILI